MEALSSYGPVKKGSYYKVVDEGRDWYLVVVRGKPVYVYKWVF